MLEWFLGTLADNVIGYVFNQSTEKIHSQFERDPIKEAFLRSLQKTVDHFEKQYPALAVEDIFKQNVYEQQYIVFLAQFLLRHGRPNPSTLASLWANALYKTQPEKRRVSMRQLEP